jgi:hypothetical protein
MDKGNKPRYSWSINKNLIERKQGGNYHGTEESDH